MNKPKVILHLFNGVISKITSDANIDLIVIEEDTEGINEEEITVSEILHTDKLIRVIDLSNPLQYLESE